MTIENERKIVLDNVNTEAELAIDNSYARKTIKQGYIGLNRIRMVQDELLIPTYTFTFKQNTTNGLVEIETDISEQDFFNLWEHVDRSLTKTRFSKEFGDELWEIDFFKTPVDQTYFIMAECEMPENRDFPINIPDFINQHQVHIVDRDDERFTSKSLTDVDSAAILYLSLMEKEYG